MEGSQEDLPPVIDVTLFKDHIKNKIMRTFQSI